MTTMVLEKTMAGRARGAAPSSRWEQPRNSAPSASLAYSAYVPAWCQDIEGASRNFARKSLPWQWIASARETVLEKVLYMTVSVAALGGISYGFWCLLDLVQRWGLFTAGIEKLAL